MPLLKIAVAPDIFDLRNNNKLPRDGCRGEGEKGVTWKDVLICKLEGIEKELKSVFQMFTKQLLVLQINVTTKYGLF